MRTVDEKFAVMDWLFVITRLNGFATPLASPDHPVNSHPSAGVAVKVTGVPGAYPACLGFFETEPSPVTLTVRLSSGNGAVLASIAPRNATTSA